MARVELLDAGPLGLGCCDPNQPLARRFLVWLETRERAGVYLRIPAIADYEVRRELLRVRAHSKLDRLKKLGQRFELVDISPAALEKAAEFWALHRQTGRPTAGPGSLDADAILAGVAATIGKPGDSVVVATTNLKHLDRFPGVEAREWESIV